MTFSEERALSTMCALSTSLVSHFEQHRMVNTESESIHSLWLLHCNCPLFFGTKVELSGILVHTTPNEAYLS